MKHIVQYSTGLASAEVARRLVAENGPHDVVLLTANTTKEDADNWRFAHEVYDRFLAGAEWVFLADGRSPMQVGRDERCVPNNRMAVCSRVLKRELLRVWIDENCDPADSIIQLGYDWTEQHRIKAAWPQWEPYKVAAPLAEPPHVMKEQLRELYRNEYGIEPPRLYAAGFQHANCLAPETRFITDQGVKTLRECVGQQVRVLGRGGGWRDAEIRSFGEQELLLITLQRYGDSKQVYATADHLWPVRRAAGRSDYTWRLTADLRPGQRIAGMYGRVRHNVVPSAIGIAAGFTFGDGTADRPKSGQITPARAFLCGSKDQALLPYFSSCRTSTRGDGVVVVRDLPRSWKKTPDLGESQSYLYGWLAGYFAADGTFAKGSARLSSSNREHLEFTRDLCARIGIGCNEIRVAHRKGFSERETPLYTLALSVSTLRSDFFLIEEHRRRFEERPGNTPRRADWQIVSVERTGRRDEVMCAVVPDGHMFTLDGNLLTHNCGGACVRGGQAQWELLLRWNRDRYLEWEADEEETRAELGKDVSILRDRTRGTTRPLPLRTFRERLERQPSLFDADDWGACGCLVDAEGEAS